MAAGVLERTESSEEVAIVFVDVADFTAFTARNGDGAAVRLMAELTQLVTRIAGSRKGRVVKRLGDGFLLAFPSASQAVGAAVSIRDALRRQRQGDSRVPARVRIAMHTGSPLLDAGDLLGHDVNVAARLLDACRRDEVVVSEATKTRAERRLRKFLFSNERVVPIRGLGRGVTVYSANAI